MSSGAGESIKMEDGTHIYRGILIGLAGIFLGVVANNYVRKRENRRILGMLIEEKHLLESKSDNGSLTEIEKRLLDRLQTEIYLMKFKCDA